MTSSHALEGHVIVCGLRGVGLLTVEQLHRSGVPVVVVDDDPDSRLSRIVEGWGVRHVRASAHRGNGLAEAGLATASAVICVEDSELSTLEIALRVRETRPDLRLVVQLANPSVGAALELVSGVGSVLDVATLASPAFIDACTQKLSHEIELGGQRFAVAEVTLAKDTPAGATFRTRFGDLAPVAVLTAEGGELTACPGRDHPVEAGDHVAVLGTVGELAQSGIDVHVPEDPTHLSRSPIRRVRQLVRELLSAGTRGLTFAVVAVVSLLTLATVLLHFAYVRAGHGHLPFLTSAYFAVETVATVGFGDFSYASQPAWLKVFAILFILSGVTLVTTTFALFTNFLVSRRIERVLGSLRVPGMSGHVIVVGLGSVGIRVVEGLLAQGRRVVVVERDSNNRYLVRARALGVPVVIADATQRQTHAAVNLKEASAVAVMTSDDLTNIESGLAVRDSLGERWDDVPVVLRVFDRNLARLMESSFGFGEVRSTAALAAPFFVGAALGLDILGTFFIEHQPFLVGRLTVAEEGGLQGLAMKDLSARTRVIALRRAGGQLEHPPRRGTRFQGGDEAFLLGPYEELLAVLRRDQGSFTPLEDADTSSAQEASAVEVETT